MLSSLSDRTKWFLVYSAILLVAVCNILIGQNWATTSGPLRLAATDAGNSYAPFAPAQTAPANSGGMQPDGNAPGILKSDTFRPSAAAPATAPAAETAPPKCDVTACAQAYRTFRESDCSYMPSAGARRLCTKGQPPQ